jgi:trehalose 6-phosphate synthase/phosphatase
MEQHYTSGYGAENDSSVESTLTDVRAVIAQLQEDLIAKGTRLSGRIIHVTHYLPIVTSLKSSNKSSDNVNASSTSLLGIAVPPSPPKTPVKDIVSLEAEKTNKTGELMNDAWSSLIFPLFSILFGTSRFLDAFPDVVDQPLPLPARFETALPSPSSLPL